MDRQELAARIGEEHEREHEVRLTLIGLIGAAADEVCLGYRTMDVAELQELVRCWFLLAGEDTPAERVLAAIQEDEPDLS